MEKMTLRSGVANPPKLERWASPQHWTRTPDDRRGRQVGRHREGRPAVEGERGADHAPVAEGEQVGQAPLLRREDHLDRVPPAGGRLPCGVRLPGTRCSGGPCPPRTAPPATGAGLDGHPAPRPGRRASPRTSPCSWCSFRTSRTSSGNSSIPSVDCPGTRRRRRPPRPCGRCGRRAPPVPRRAGCRAPSHAPRRAAGVTPASCSAACSVASMRAPARSTMGEEERSNTTSFSGSGERADLLPDGLAHVLDVEVEQRRLDADHQRARDGLVVRVALHVGEAPGAGDAAEEGHVGVGGAPDEQQERDHHRHHHALEDAEQQHGGEGDHRHGELEAADPPDVAQLADVDRAPSRRPARWPRAPRWAGWRASPSGTSGTGRWSPRRRPARAASGRRPCRSPRTATGRRPPGRPGRAPRPGSPRPGRAAPGADRSRSGAPAPARAPRRRSPRTRAACRRTPAGSPRPRRAAATPAGGSRAGPAAARRRP